MCVVQGSDFSTIYTRSTDSPFTKVKYTEHSESGRLPDELRYVKFSTIEWTHDSKGFFYQVTHPSRKSAHKQANDRAKRLPERKSHGDAKDDKAGTETDQDLDAMLYYHRIGTPQCKTIKASHFSVYDEQRGHSRGYLDHEGCISP